MRADHRHPAGFSGRVHRVWRGVRISAAAGFWLWLASPAGAVVVYETNFDSMAVEYTLSGQEGWMQYNAASSQAVQAYNPPPGNFAYLGYFPPDTGNGAAFVYRPVNVDPVALGRPIVRFQAWTLIVDGTPGDGDVFLWGVYNQNGEYLGGLVIDNGLKKFFRDDSIYSYDIGVPLANETWYFLIMLVDFENNLWSAYADTGGGLMALFEDQVFHAGSGTLHLGDIDAVWVTGASAGNNHMLFDDYRIRLLNRRELWYFQNFFLFEEQITGEVAALDEDGDGFTLDEECAYGGDPFAADGTLLRCGPGSHAEAGNTYLTLSFNRNTQNHLGFNYVLEETGSLSGIPVWNPLSLANQTTGNATLDGGFERVAARGTRKMTGNGSVSSGFLRMRIVPDS